MMLRKMEELIAQYGLNGFGLKLIAISSMLIDHIGAILFPDIIIFRIIGRLAFPIFCMLISEGAFYTTDIRKYETRLLIFAVLSEIPFDLAFHSSLIELSSQNVFFTLLIGLVCIDILRTTNHQLRILIVCGLIVAAELLKTDYGAFGVILILIFYRFHDQRMIGQFMFWVYNLLFFQMGIQMFACFSSGFLCLYSGKRGPRLKWFFYLFYPVHLLVLWWIRKMNHVAV